MIVIQPEDFASADCLRLVEAARVELRSRYGPFGAPPPLASDFVEPEGIFLVAREGLLAIGCGGIRRLEEGVAEIRRMYTIPERRGLGVGQRVLGELERWSRRFGYRTLRLETGWLQPDGLALYERGGFRVIPCYGEFNDRESVCMEKVLAQ